MQKNAFEWVKSWQFKSTIDSQHIMVTFYTIHNNDNDITSVRLCFHEQQPIACPHRQAMGCLPWDFWRKKITIYWECTTILTITCDSSMRVSYCASSISHVNTLRLRQRATIFKWIFVNENVWIFIKISLKFVPKGAISNIPALVRIMPWRQSGNKPLSQFIWTNDGLVSWRIYTSLSLDELLGILRKSC